MIWEDMYGRPASGSAEEELKFVRDFVSHGEELGSPALLKFLEREFGRPVTQFDPHDSDHARFVRDRRDWAWNLVERELSKYLE